MPGITVASVWPSYGLPGRFPWWPVVGRPSQPERTGGAPWSHGGARYPLVSFIVSLAQPVQPYASDEKRLADERADR
jgi:hypothetical protein